MKKSIELWGIVSDCRECAKIDNLVKNYRFTITTDDGEKYNAFAIEPNMLYDLEDGKHIYAKGVIEDGVFVAGYVDRWGRYCDHCGKHHEEGYWIGEYEYACSEECAIALMGGKAEFDEAVAEYDDDANYNPICWVEWYN